MTSTLRQSAALDRIIALWVVETALFFRSIVEVMLTIAAIVGISVHQIGARRGEPWQPLPARDRDEFGPHRSKLINMIDSNISAGDSGDRPASAFSHSMSRQAVDFRNDAETWSGHLPMALTGLRVANARLSPRKP